jgi:hypothetical protein
LEEGLWAVRDTDALHGVWSLDTCEFDGIRCVETWSSRGIIRFSGIITLLPTKRYSMKHTNQTNFVPWLFPIDVNVFLMEECDTTFYHHIQN